MANRLRISQFTLLTLTGLMMIAAVCLTQSRAQTPDVTSDSPLLKFYEPREFSNASGDVLQYRLAKPVDFDPEKKYPLVIFLHGAGERGSDNMAQLKHGAGDIASEANRKKYPCYVLAPQCPKDHKWVEIDWSKPKSDMPTDPGVTMHLLKGLIDSMVETAGIDSDRVYITGLSMGGFGTWDAIARYENFFAAAAPICGGGDPATAKKFVGLPLWAFHGGVDPVVKPERSREMIEALKAEGGHPRYTEYENVAHDSWTDTYKNPEFYEWLFSHKKG